MRRLAPLAMLAALGCEAEPKANRPAAPTKAAASQPARPAPRAEAKAKPRRPEPRAPATMIGVPKQAELTESQKKALDAHERPDLRPYEGKWIQVEPDGEGGWVIEAQCDAGVPTLTVDLSPEQFSLHLFHGQETERITFDFATERAGGVVLLDRKAGAYVELIALTLVNEGQILRASRSEAEAVYFVPAAKRGGLKTVTPKCPR